ncbi:hypothetical protein [Pedobacter sp. UBA4863]|uniref:hypothetical protein n=1 Tax=Pedobacter sp. UBA4863 TaxID=1947060 RepID=UPI0025E4FBDC|nr:hypothetical protein [Pedobacter sp. UBA4863]
MNALEKYIGDLNPSVWLNADYVNGFDVIQPNLGDDINNWVDCSGNMRNASNVYNSSMNTNSPTFQVDVNNKPYLQFLPASFQYLGFENLRTSTFYIWQTERTIVLVSKNDIGSSSLQQGVTWHNEGMVRLGNGACQEHMTNGISGFLGFRTPASRDIYDYKVSIKRGIRGVKNDFANQNDIISANTTNNLFNDISSGIDYRLPYSTQGLSLGCRMYIGGAGWTTDSFVRTDVYQVILWDRCLNNIETKQVQTYLKLKYNI